VVTETSGNQYGSGSALRAVNVGSGRSYVVFSQSAAIAGPPPSRQLSAYALNARGWSAVVLDHLDADRGPNRSPTVVVREVSLMDPRGASRQLDVTFTPGDVDPASLILDGHTALWTHGGAVQYARF